MAFFVKMELKQSVCSIQPIKSYCTNSNPNPFICNPNPEAVSRNQDLGLISRDVTIQVNKGRKFVSHGIKCSIYDVHMFMEMQLTD